MPDQPPTRLMREIVTFLHEFPGATSPAIARGLERDHDPVLVCVGELLLERYVVRDGHGGYCSSERWEPGPAGDDAAPLATAAQLAHRALRTQLEDDRDHVSEAGEARIRQQIRNDELTVAEQLMQERARDYATQRAS